MQVDICCWLHGCNGLSAAVSVKIYTSHVLPRLLYGLECLSFAGSQLKEIEGFHIKSLQLQFLSAGRVCTSGGPVHYHLGMLSLLGRIMHSNNGPLVSLAMRQCAVSDLNSNSWFMRCMPETVAQIQPARCL